jgi:uncharacterized membrane protein YgcG
MKLLVAISVFVVCLNLSAQKEQTITCKWLDNSSGNAVPAASDYVPVKKGALSYCLSNDDKNMYVDIKITESIEQGKVLQMGLVLWLNTDGKSRKITGIRYPVGAKYSRAMRARGEPQAALNQETPLSLANTIQLIGFKDANPKSFPSNNTDNFRGSVKYDNDGNLLYSMTIPLAKLPEGGKSSNGKIYPMNIAIEYGAPPQTGGQSGSQSGFPSASSRGGGSGGGRSGGGRSGGGGSRGGGGGEIGGGPPSMSSSAQDLPKPVLIWLKNIALAEKK